MTLPELKDLLPLYVAGSLSEEQRAEVQNALTTYPELKEDIRFWEGMKQATLLEAVLNKEQHPSAEQIVSYAEGSLPAGEVRLYVEHHVQSCESCRNELTLLQDSDDKASVASLEKRGILMLWKEKRLSRPAFAVMLLAVVVAGVLYLRSYEAPVQQATHQPQARETASVVSPKAEHVKRIAFVLPYTGTLRHPSATRAGIPVLILADSVVLVDITIPVEHSAIAAGYRVDATSPKGSRKKLADSVQPATRTDGLRTLLLSVGRDQFSADGKYVLDVRELLKEGISDIDPEEYRFEFEVRRAPPR